jgi:hypothetical protein
LTDLISDPDGEKSQRAMKAMLGMRKIDIGALEAAAEGHERELTGSNRSRAPSLGVSSISVDSFSGEEQSEA